MRLLSLFIVPAIVLTAAYFSRVPTSCSCATHNCDLSTADQQDVVNKPLTMPQEGKLPIAIVVGKDAEVLDFCGPLEVFAFAYNADGVPAFDPFLVAQTTDPVKVGAGMNVVPKYSFSNAPQPKIIVIPAMSNEAATPEMLNWIRSASEKTDVTMSVCNGAFVLAQTGLLDGKTATSHHGSYFRFAGTFPKVKLRRGARFVEDGNLASAGGVSSGIDLALRVVQRYLGNQSAKDIADGIEYQGQGWLYPDSNQAYTKFAETNEEHPICPLCQMEGLKSLKSAYAGKNYYFCHESEKEFFDKHLEVVDRFLKEDANNDAR